MQQFKTYPGIPPNGVVERPSILRIPPPSLLRERPPLAFTSPLLCLSPLPCARVLLHLTWEFRSYKLGLWSSVCINANRNTPPPPGKSRQQSFGILFSLSSSIILIIVIKTRGIDPRKKREDQSGRCQETWGWGTRVYRREEVFLVKFRREWVISFFPDGSSNTTSASRSFARGEGRKT